MTIMKVRAIGSTRLEALHALLSELESLGVPGIEYGNVVIEREYQYSLDSKVVYSATWR